MIANMTIRQKMKFILTVVLLLITLLNAYGQKTLSKEREREIKTSGKYYYGECSAFDVETASSCALKNLTQDVLVALVQQSIKSDELEMQKAMEMRAEIAPLSLTGKIRMLAWIEKDSVFSTTATKKVLEPTPTEEIALPPPPPAPNPISTSSISNPIIRDLAACETFEQFRRTADGFKRQGKLIYGSNKSSFLNPDRCLVAVFTKEQKLIALLDIGQSARKDLLTGNTIQNIDRHFAEKTFYYIQIND